MVNNYLTFKQDLFNPKRNKESLFYRLKHSYSFSEQVKTIKHIPKAFNGFLYGQSLFKSEDDFGSQPMQYISDAEKQLNWDCHLFYHNADRINLFLSLKQTFENSFLKGDYETAHEALEKVQKSVCASYWGLENLFLLTQYQRGLEFNFKLLNECKGKSLKDGLYFMYAHFFSYKVEDDVSFFSYESNLNMWVKYFSDEYKHYLNYRFNPIEFNYENLSDVLTISTKTSLIDRYIIFRDIVAHLLPDPNYKEKISQWCKHLQSRIHDPLLSKSLNFLENSSSKEIRSNSEYILRIIDLYTEGRYAEVIIASIPYIKDKAIDVALLEIYVKSHIFLGRGVEPIPSISGVINNIVLMMYDFLMKGQKTTENFVDLLTLTNAISSFDISKCLQAFLELDIEQHGNIIPSKSFLFSQIYNPGHYNLYDTESEKINFLDSLTDNKQSLTVDFFKYLVNFTEEFPNNDSIPSYRLKFYQARVLMTLKDFITASKLLESIITECTTVGFFQEAVTHLLFSCYVALNAFDQAVSLYVEQFIKNNELTSRVDGKILANKIITAKFKNVAHSNINLPIFIYLAQDEAHAKFIAYDVYMRSIATDRPTKIEMSSDQLHHLIYFLRHVATPKVISKKVLVFKNSSEVMKERIGICQMLFKVDPTSASEYSKEISEHTQRLIVQQRIKEIDQSMIYVDENGIIAHELGEINKNFNRFRNISELLKNSNIDATGINLDALYSLVLGQIDTDAYKRSIRKTNIHFQLFEQIFLEIRDKFLFSNHYGLDYYLSQRIRHGTIIGQLRKHFQQQILVTSKDTSEGTYLRNTFWLNKLDLDEEQAELFANRMTDFSVTVDKLILDLKDKSIQIKTEDPKTNQAGWFNYMYIPEWHSEELRLFFLSKIQFVTDFQDFVKLIFEVLWNQTTEILEDVRHQIDTKIKTDIISIIDDLEIDLVNILGTENNSKAIFKSIADCRTNVQEDVDAVVRWFNKSKSDEVDFTLSDAFNTSLAIVNNINSPFTINFDEKLEKITMFKGAFFSHFVDLLKIFITNIFNYYRNNNLLSSTAQVSFFIDNNILNITFSSNLSENEDLNTLQTKIDEIKADLVKANYKGIRGEGNTGFSKANNIVKNVLRNKLNEIRINLDNDLFVTVCLIDINTLVV